MRLWRVFIHRLHSLFRRPQAEADLQSEMEVHLAQLIKEQVSAGVPEPEARLAALREFGPVSLVKDECRDTRRINFLADLAQDLSYAFRSLKNTPAFTLTALISLALAIGANTAIYSFMDAIFLRALPVPDPGRLFIVNWRAHDGPNVVHSIHGGDFYKTREGLRFAGTFPYATWQLFAENNDTTSGLFAFANAGGLNVVARNQASLGMGEYVSGNFFSQIGTIPSAGRLLDDNDDRSSASPAAVISYRFWQQHFNGAPNAIGETILVDRHPFTIAGVTSPEFRGVNPQRISDVYLPLHSIASIDPQARAAWFAASNNTYWLEMMGRLRPGVSLRQAEAAMSQRFRRFALSTAVDDRERANLPELWLQDGGSGLDPLRRQFREPLTVLMTMTALILAIACANLANLLLARSTNRRKEFALRASLGAGRFRIVRQLLTESVLVSLLAGFSGLCVAWAAIHFLTWLLSNGNPDFTLNAKLDLRVLLFAALISLATGVIFGLVPAIRASKTDLTPVLKESRTITQRRRGARSPFGLSQVLVAGQIGLSLVLVIAAGLFATTLRRLHSVALGFNKESLLVFNLDAMQAGYDRDHAVQLYEALRTQFSLLPGVQGATMSDMPLVANSTNLDGIWIDGQESKSAPNDTIVGPTFFSTMQIKLLRGRSIDAHDTASSPHVAVVNEAFAKTFFPHRDALGEHVSFDKKGPQIQIVGLAKNTQYDSLKTAPPPIMFVPWTQPSWPFQGLYYEVRTVGDPLMLASAIRQVVHRADPQIPIAQLSTESKYIDSTVSSERTFAHLCTLFGLLALVIACVGLYGTLSYAVARRTNEIGIRLALGAQRRRVIWMVLGEVVALCLAGLASGLLVAWQAGHFVASFLFGVQPTDVLTFGGSALLLALSALIAGYLPAWRASRIDPMEALRHE